MSLSPFSFNSRVDLDGSLARFDPISLAEMQNVALMDRLDTKFTFKVADLPGVLDQVLPDYRLLSLGGIRSHRYETLYFDTHALEFYAQHHNGVYSRHKVRCRRCVDSGLCFFEVKTKNNKGRTIKHRVRCPGIVDEIAANEREFLERVAPRVRADVHPVLWVAFRRLTLVSKASLERLTIDLDLSYRTEDSSVSFPGLAIAEVKRSRLGAPSPFVQAMRQRRLKEGSMSKYCFGIVNLYPKAKHNLFKERFKQIKEMAA